jgi:uncharacterized protein DUF6624
MVDEELRQELVAMRAEDHRVRDELMAAGELGGPYVPRMEEVHTRNAARLRELIGLRGWPAEDIAGMDGAEAAWIIAQHSVGEPSFQRRGRDPPLLGRVAGEQRMAPLSAVARQLASLPSPKYTRSPKNTP